MRDGSPNAMDLRVDALDVAEPVEARRGDALRPLERRSLLGEHAAHGRLDVLGPHRVEGRQRARFDQGIAGG